MELILLDLNFWLIPYPGSRDLKQRMQKFIQLVNKLNPDIITLQELWLKKYINYLEKSLPSYHLTIPENNYINRSGLLTLSKAKPISTSFFIFPKEKGFNLRERLGHKGILTIKIKINNKVILVHNTHLYNPREKEHNIFPRNQFRIMKEKIKKGDNIISGDLNLPKNELKQINKGEFQLSPSQEATFSDKNEYQRKFSSFHHHTNKKTDYIITKFNSVKTTIKEKIITSPLFSDHYPILASIKF